MVRRLSILITILCLLPITILGLSFLKVTSGQNETNTLLELEKEIELSAKQISDFLQERYNDIKLWGELSTPKVALDFERPEGLRGYLNSLVDGGKIYERIFVFDRDLKFFAASDLGSSRLNPVKFKNAAQKYRKYINL